MRGLGFILFLVAIQVIAALIQHRKKQQEKRAREDAARQRSLQQMGAPAGGRHAGVPVESPHSAPVGDDLEARRRAQLEQLRQRRELRRADVRVSEPASVRMGLPPSSQAARRAREPIMVAPTIGTSDRARTQANEAARRARDSERQRRQQQADLAAEMQEVEEAAARARYERTFHSVAGESDARAHGVDAPATSETRPISADQERPDHRFATEIRNRVRQPAALRELIVMREILDMPIGLRHES